MNLACHCGFDLGELPAKRRVVATDGKELAVTCPLCGKGVTIRVEALGVLVRGTGTQTRYYRWKVGKETHASALAVGTGARFQLTFDAIEPIEPRSVCYPAVPAFEDEAGRLVVPALPVRAAHYDAIDLPAYARLVAEGKHAAVVGGEYQAYVPLLGLAEPYLARLPLHRTRDAEGVDHAAVRGLNLRVWPNTPLKSWRYYLVGLAACGPTAPDLGRFQVAARTQGAAEWTPLASVQRKGTALSGAFEGRPTWISLELDHAAAGGVFSVPPAAEAAPVGQLELGLDFGTSNTCVVSRDEGKEISLLGKIPESRWNLYLITGGAEAVQHGGPDLWPAPTGFGANDDLFASELVFPTPRAQLALGKLADWRYGIDYGIPSASAEPTYAEAEYALAEFKWTQLLTRTAPTFAPHIETLQRKYLTAVLLAAYLRTSLASPSRHWPSDVTVTYSYPMSFSAEDMKALGDALTAAQHDLEAHTGIVWRVRTGLDESTAAARNAGSPDANLFVYLDMGGGSTDIAVTLARLTDRPPEAIYLTSLRYAGATLLSGYSGDGKQTSCLAGKATIDQLRRRVREAKTVTQVTGDPTLFDQKQQSVTQNRTRHFYGYIVEHVARMLAAGFLDQRFTVAKPDGTFAVPDVLKTRVFFLGNGWRFDAVLSPDIEATLANKIYLRMQELVVAEAKANDYARAVVAVKRVKIELKHAGLQNVPHGKAAVAFGLLKEKDRSTATPPDSMGPAQRSILGWTTLIDNGDSVPWFAHFNSAEQRPVPPSSTGLAAGSNEGFMGDEAAPASEDIPTPWYKQFASSPSLDWKNVAPRLPPELMSPFELDPDLDMTRGALRRSCARADAKWFLRSPFEVMLEELFGPKLRTLGA